MRKTTKPWHVTLIRHLREWHRKLGIFAAFFLIFLSLTGIALNHTDSLNLAHQPIKNSWMLNHYGIQAPTDIRFYPITNDVALFVTDHLVWFQDKVLLESDETIIALGQFKGFIIVVTSNQLYLYNLSGELIDRLDDTSGIPASITAMAINDKQLYLKTNNGIYQSDQDLFDWQLAPASQVLTWVKAKQAPASAVVNITREFKSQFLTLERLIVDAHSGRVFGMIGIIFMDLVGFLLILLSLSGIYIWIRYARAKR